MTYKFIPFNFFVGCCNPLEVLSVVLDDKAFPTEKESKAGYRSSTSSGSLTGTCECEV